MAVLTETSCYNLWQVTALERGLIYFYYLSLSLSLVREFNVTHPTFDVKNEAVLEI